MKLKQISQIDELEGKTIKTTIDLSNSIAVIFTDETFVVFYSEYESSSINLSCELGITDLLAIGAINKQEAEALRADEKAAWDRQQKENRRRQYLQLEKEFGTKQP